jgi:hypothetical protein
MRDKHVLAQRRKGMVNPNKKREALDIHSLERRAPPSIKE